MGGKTTDSSIAITNTIRFASLVLTLVLMGVLLIWIKRERAFNLRPVCFMSFSDEFINKNTIKMSKKDTTPHPYSFSKESFNEEELGKLKKLQNDIRDEKIYKCPFMYFYAAFSITLVILVYKVCSVITICLFPDYIAYFPKRSVKKIAVSALNLFGYFLVLILLATYFLLIVNYMLQASDHSKEYTYYYTLDIMDLSCSKNKPQCINLVINITLIALVLTCFFISFYHLVHICIPTREIKKSYNRLGDSSVCSSQTNCSNIASPVQNNTLK